MGFKRFLEKNILDAVRGLTKKNFEKFCYLIKNKSNSLFYIKFLNFESHPYSYFYFFHS